MIDPRYALLAAVMAHVEGFYSIKSTAYRNRNPGNIRTSAGPMQVYPTMLAGFTALINDIAANKGKTLTAFIHKYAPTSENDTNMYLQVVSTLTGILPTDIL